MNHEAGERQDRSGYETAQKDARTDEAGAIHGRRACVRRAEHRLKRGDIVKLVDHHVAPDGTEGYSIKVFNALGDTIAVTAVLASALEPLREDEILCARSMTG